MIGLVRTARCTATVACRGQRPQPIILELSECASISRATTSATGGLDVSSCFSISFSFSFCAPPHAPPPTSSPTFRIGARQLRDLRGKSGARDSTGSVCGRHTRAARRNWAAGCRRSHTHTHTRTTRTHTQGRVARLSCRPLHLAGYDVSGSFLSPSPLPSVSRCTHTWRFTRETRSTGARSGTRRGFGREFAD